MSKIQKSKYKHYVHNKKVKKSLDVNLKGFLCTCNSREKDCVKESYNLLNKYADALLSTVSTQPNPPKEEIDIQDELKKELADLKSGIKKPFQVVESGAKNLLFITTTLDDPVQLAEKIVSDIAQTKIQQTRFLIRLIPIEATCKAYLKDIENAFKPLAARYFNENPQTFSVVFNHRNNNSVNRNEVIKSIADIVFETRSDHKVNLKGAELSIIIEVIRGIALIGVVPNFIKYKKYNLLALSGNTEETKMEKEQDVEPDQII